MLLCIVAEPSVRINKKGLDFLKDSGRIIARFFLLLGLSFICVRMSFGEIPKRNPVDDNGYRYIPILEVDDEISVDGQLNEAVWQITSFQDQFLQREPDFGHLTTEKTEIAVLKDEKNLYLGIKCYDSSPSLIIANEMRRDANVDNDDNFELILDTFNDRRNGYYFIINPNGVKRDATLGDEGKTFNPDWDGIWDCATEINDQGWFIEIAIPWKTLRFDTRRDSLWGINFARKIRRKNEHVYWQLISLDAGRGGLFRLSQAGYLRGLKNIQAQGNLDIIPYIMGGVSREAETMSSYKSVKEVGIDATFALTSNLNLKLSLNTDFAQVESDQALVNLTRFSLYYPEKREFFLDGAEMFNFGGGRLGHRGSSGNTVNLFYSRRIGIVESHQQPIIGGVKLLGKTESWQIGVLNMQTESFDAVEDSQEVHYPGSNFSVLRVKKNLFKRSSIGIMLLNKHNFRSTYYNRSGGIDGIFPISDTFSISGSVAATIGPSVSSVGLNNKNMAGSLAIDFNSDLWHFKVEHLSIQENFNAEMGFIRRTDIRNTSSLIGYYPRPLNSSTIRQFEYQLAYNYVTDQDNRLLESDIDASFEIKFQNSARFNLGIAKETEYIPEDWEVRENLIIPMAKYEGWESDLRISTDASRDLSTQISLKYGDYYTGKRFSLRPGVVIKTIPRVRADLDFRYDSVTLSNGSFDIRTIACRIYYFLSTSFYIKAYIQWQDDRLANNGDSIALSNILFHWIYKPGSDIYLVYNEGWKMGAVGNRMFNRTLLLKFTYFWRN